MGMNFSQITDHLFIGTPPRSEAYPSLRELGVRLVINMCWERRPRPDRHTSPMPTLWLPVFDSPFLLIPLPTLLKGVRAALETIVQGGRVYVHCAQGMHRSVAMGAAILIAQNFTPREAMELIKQRRRVADPDAWHIRRQILRFAQSWGAEYSLHNQAQG